jgi:FlaA1/EpsC-like NDP-sugar epimerase
MDFFAEILNDNSITNVMLIGVGNMGRALLHYRFHERNKMKIVMAFETDDNPVVGTVDQNVPIYGISQIEEKIKEAKEILAKSDAKIDDLNKASEDLGQILQTVGAAIYQQQQPGQPGPDAGQANPEEPKADSKSDDKKQAEEGEVVQ